MSENATGASSQNLLVGIGLVAFAGCLLATQDAIIKQMVVRVSPFQMSAIRFALHAAYVVVFFRLRGNRIGLRTAHLGLQFARAASLLASSLSMHLSLLYLPLSQATVVQFLGPLIVTVLSVLFLGERIGRRRVGALVAGFAGVVMIIGPEMGSGANFAWLLPFMSAVFSAIYVLLTRRLSHPDEAGPALLLLPVLCMSMLVPVQPFVWQPLSVSDLGLVLILSWTGAASHVAIQLGMRSAPASVLSPFLYSQVLFACAIGIFVFSDSFGPPAIIGTALIVGAGLAIWWIERKRSSAKREASADGVIQSKGDCHAPAE